MNREDVQYRTLGMFHEIQVGSFSVIGRFPVLVLAHLKVIFEKSGLPLFVGRGQSVRVILDDADEIFQEDPAFPNRTLILDPLNDSHKKLADRFQGGVSWFCIRNLTHANYRGTFFDNVNRELFYCGENERERFELPRSMQVTRELAAAICAARESGIRPDEIGLAIKANAGLSIPTFLVK